MAKQEDPASRAGENKKMTQKEKVHLAAGLAIALVLIVLNAWMLAVRKGQLQRAEWVAFYVSIGLVSGLIFWLVTPGGEATLTIKKVGARLTGGAAVGGTFMFIAHWLTPGPELRALELPMAVRESRTIRIVDQERAIEAHLVERRWVLVEFRGAETKGQFTVEYFVGLNSNKMCFQARRVGELRQCPPKVDAKGLP